MNISRCFQSKHLGLNIKFNSFLKLKRLLTYFAWLFSYFLGSLCSKVLQPTRWREERRSKWYFLVFLYVSYQSFIRLFCHFIFLIMYCKIACATAGETRKWMEAFDQAKQQVERIAIFITYFVFLHMFFFFYFSYMYLSLNYNYQAEFELSQSSTRHRLNMENEYAISWIISYNLLRPLCNFTKLSLQKSPLLLALKLCCIYFYTQVFFLVWL